MPKPGDAPAKEPVDSIQEALGDAYDAQLDSDDAGGETAATPAAGDGTPADDKGPARGPDGKFAKKDETPAPAADPAATAATDPAAAPAAQQQPPAGAIEPEEHWSEQDKIAFRAIPPEHRSWVMERYKRLESDNTRKSQEAASLRSYKQQLDAIIEPQRHELQAMGVDDVGAVRMLFGIRDYLRRDPVAGIQWLAGQFGVDIAQLANTPPPDPAAAAVRQTEQQLGGRLTQLEQQIQNDRMQQAWRVLDTFSQEKDTTGALKHPHFEAVVNDMTQLMKSGMVPLGDLQQAYEKALRLHPELSTPAAPAAPPATPAAPANSAQAATQKKDDTLDKAATAAKAKKAARGVDSGGSGKAEHKMSLHEELAARVDGSMQ